MIFVDEPVRYPDVKLRYKTWSHLWCDGDLAELHALADRIGLQRRWFQAKPGRPIEFQHYDVTPPMRLLAIQLGATPMQFGDYRTAKLTQEARRGE